MSERIDEERTSSWRWIIENRYLLILLITSSSLKLYSICFDFESDSTKRVGNVEYDW